MFSWCVPFSWKKLYYVMISWYVIPYWLTDVIRYWLIKSSGVHWSQGMKHSSRKHFVHAPLAYQNLPTGENKENGYENNALAKIWSTLPIVDALIMRQTAYLITFCKVWDCIPAQPKILSTRLVVKYCETVFERSVKISFDLQKTRCVFT